MPWDCGSGECDRFLLETDCRRLDTVPNPGSREGSIDLKVEEENVHLEVRFCLSASVCCGLCFALVCKGVILIRCMQGERKEREVTEETLLKLLEETCLKVNYAQAL